MKLLITVQELEILRSRDSVPCECEQCGNIFHVTKNLAQRGLKGTKAVRFCSNNCKRKLRKPLKEGLCLFCNKLFEFKREAKFCSQSCSSRYHGRIKRKEPKHKFCLNCGEPNSRGASKCCSKSCAWKYKEANFRDSWLAGGISGNTASWSIPTFIVNYVWKKFQDKCAECGWNDVNPATNKTPLHIHHIDGDSRNNKEENLKLLCPNCHALTPNFGRLNKSGTREWRRLHDE